MKEQRKVNDKMKQIWKKEYNQVVKKSLSLIILVTIGFILLGLVQPIFYLLFPLLIICVASLFRQSIWVADRKLALYTGVTYLKAYFVYISKETTPFGKFVIKWLWMFVLHPYPECRLTSIRKYDKARQGLRVTGK